MTDRTLKGTVFESFGRRVVVATASGERLDCRLRGRRLAVVVGDDVLVERGAHTGEWTVIGRVDRRNVFARSDSRGLAEDLAANLDQIGIVVASRPTCDPFIVDRYLAGAVFAAVAPLLIVNKSDLETEDPGEVAWQVFERIGVPLVRVSARTGGNVDGLRARLEGRRTLLAGQSGVGKSTLFNALSGGAYRATRTLSSVSQEGRHTTVSSAIVALPWGELVDSPGVRDYAPPLLMPLRDIQRGYAEIASEGASCRFLDCLHVREPDCAVRQSVESGATDARRYESYRRLLNLSRQLGERRGHRP